MDRAMTEGRESDLKNGAIEPTGVRVRPPDGPSS